MMHYYKRNLGDYSKKAGRLSMLQHGAYTLLIDACYDREQFPTYEEAIDWTWASSKEEVEAVEFVLKKFFVLESGVYVQNRIRQELIKYQESAATNKRVAMEREEKRMASGGTNRDNSKTKRARVVDDTLDKNNETTPNHKPITNNQEPLKSKERGNKRFAPPSLDEVANYCTERINNINPQAFLDFYQAKGWMVGKNKMKDWKACVRTWEQRNNTGGNNAANQKPGKLSLAERVTENRKRAERVIAQQRQNVSTVGEDGAHLRPPLDGDFRRDSS